MCRCSGECSYGVQRLFVNPVQIFPALLSDAAQNIQIQKNGHGIRRQFSLYACRFRKIRDGKFLRHIDWDKLHKVLRPFYPDFVKKRKGHSVIAGRPRFLLRLQPFNSRYSSISIKGKEKDRLGSFKKALILYSSENAWYALPVTGDLCLSESSRSLHPSRSAI